MRLLLAEDEKEMAHALEAVFTHNYYSVDVVYNGIDAATGRKAATTTVLFWIL